VVRGMSGAILEASQIIKDFHRFRALDKVDITVEKGALHAIIGPNGAGKTTFFNVITGKLRPEAGRVFFDGTDITNWTPERRVYIGLGRAFQIVNIFPSLSVIENIMIPIIMRHKAGMNMISNPRTRQEIMRESQEIVEIIDIAKKADLNADALSHGDKKKLDIGIALASQPSLLILDEPTAGLPSEETESLVKLVQHLHSEKDMSIVFVEHNISVVFTIAEKITVFNEGKVIAEGEPQEVREDRAVIEAYLGEEV
jgi:branched-chain amino acid transport system ATP-binding protein